MAETISIPQKFNRLYDLIIAPDFIEGKGLGGEVASYITTYAPEDQNEVTIQIRHLKKNLDTHGIPVIIINLYETVIEFLQQQRQLDKIFEQEVRLGKKKLFDSLVSIFEVKTVLVPLIEKKVNESSVSVIFLTGIGEVYPYLRAHNVLESLAALASRIPLIAFFPGGYDGIRLTLFERMRDKNHYRAFNLDYKL